ncbi:chaperonin-containing tcp1 subunit 8 (theta) [Anaeramoeba ignava]|uniref:T-complex protein 1 subunit alpha n=1 Tax=Anaeramoeba ignava TaxID=1746090 RepID=A0A9Q0R8Q2_ANAIG|nr:chaperonin-containing tcp1 subunit 8 (theta) [Anaeramoeba ignava]
MSLRFSYGAPNSQSLIKDGTLHLHGVDRAVLKNIDACKGLSDVTTSSYGPNGMNKIVINHLDKLFVTNDSATIVKELEIAHPAARMIVQAAQMQEKEVGDGTNFVIVFAGELLKQAENLIKTGLHPVEIIDGYTKALEKAIEILDELVVENIEKMTNEELVAKAIQASIASKQYGNEEFLSKLVAKACIQILPSNQKNFNVDNIRVSKIVGGSVYDSNVVKGFIAQRKPESSVTHVENAKVVVYSCGVEAGDTETKGNTVFESAQQMLNYNQTEEDSLEAKIKFLHDAGVKVIVSENNISEMAVHFIEKYGLMAIKIPSKFDIQRLCKAIKATALVRFDPPTQEELGFCSEVKVQEIAGTTITVFSQSEKQKSLLSTIIIRGSTKNILDNIERGIDDGVNSFKALCKNGKLLYGGGATEVQMARIIQKYGEESPGLNQYSIRKFGEALEIVPRKISDNSGMKSNEIISNLYAEHEKGNKSFGVDILNETVGDMKEKAIYDLYSTRYWGLKFAVDAVTTILRVDQIIMSRPENGPKLPQQTRDY